MRLENYCEVRSDAAGSKYPCCDLPYKLEITPDQRKKAVFVTGF